MGDYEETFKGILREFIEKENHISLIVEAVNLKADNVSKPPTFDRITETEKMLAKMELQPLTQQEALWISAPAEEAKDKIIEDLQVICKKRYTMTSTKPDFSKIGVDFEVHQAKFTRHFALAFDEL